MLRINTRSRARNSKRADLARRCAAHLKWIRGRICCVSSVDCSGRIEAAHVDHAGGKGMGLKVSDWATVPLCSHHHAKLHTGARTFEATHRVDLVALAAAFTSQSPHRRKLSADDRAQARS
jgi:hypothetical protein